MLAFAWLGLKVHDSIAELRSLGQGLADAVGGAPVVGGAVSDALRDGGDAAAGSVEKPGASAGTKVAETGRAAEEKTMSTARLLGWLTFLIPTVLLLSRTLPPRVQRARALAQHAAFNLPYGALLAHTKDPIGDLVAGRHEPLLRALGEHEGLRLSSERIV